MNDIEVSVIVPMRNEERYIARCMESLVRQTYPADRMEWLLIDGDSEDKTIEICERYVPKGPVRILHNDRKKTTYALNLGITNSSGRYIIRLDAHAEYKADYIEKCVYYLETTGADNVGGIAVTKAEGYAGNAIAKMLSSRFGVGDSSFRVGKKSGFVDTVPFGAFRREVFERVGLFNHELPRSEDNDINARIRASGGRIWLSNEIQFVYYCRDSIPAVLTMGIKNGNILFQTVRKNPRAMSLRHYVPFLFFASIAIMPVLLRVLPCLRFAYMGEFGLYFLLDVYYCMKSWNYAPILLWLYPLFHLCYGLGSFLGLMNIDLLDKGF